VARWWVARSLALNFLSHSLSFSVYEFWKWCEMAVYLIAIMSSFAVPGLIRHVSELFDLILIIDNFHPTSQQSEINLHASNLHHCLHDANHCDVLRVNNSKIARIFCLIRRVSLLHPLPLRHLHQLLPRNHVISTRNAALVAGDARFLKNLRKLFRN
jgi:hypothetical protein